MFRARNPLVLSVALVCLSGLMVSPVLAEDEPQEQPLAEVIPSQILILGPLPSPAATEEAVFPRGDHQEVPEIDPGKTLPNPDLNFSVVPGQDLQWQQVDCGTAGAVNFPDGDIHWLAAVLHLDTRTEVEFSLLGGTVLYCNGEKLDSEGNDDEYISKTTLDPGWVTKVAYWLRTLVVAKPAR